MVPDFGRFSSGRTPGGSHKQARPAPQSPLANDNNDDNHEHDSNNNNTNNTYIHIMI